VTLFASPHTQQAPRGAEGTKKKRKKEKRNKEVKKK
jgi:hypothetical protein